MSADSSQQFLSEFGEKLWTAVDTLCSHIAAAFCKHGVLVPNFHNSAMGSGGFFVEFERFVESLGGMQGKVSHCWQDQWTWGIDLRRANCAPKVRGFDQSAESSDPVIGGPWRQSICPIQSAELISK